LPNWLHLALESTITTMIESKTHRM
jgi:hypothetical protein